MRPRVAPQWQKLRGEFNHDWLKNQYMPALGKYLNILDNRVEDQDFESSFISQVLPEWEAHRAEAKALTLNFEREMSPRHLFESLPLSRCNGETKLWLGDLAHALWLRRYPVGRWVSEAAAAVEGADAAYRQLRGLSLDPGARPAEGMRRYRAEFAEFRRRCQELANAVSKFPSEIKAV